MTQIAVSTSPLAELAEGCHDTAERELVREFMARLGDRWTVQVIQQLIAGEVRFTELMERIPGISHRMLAKTLKALERDGLLVRRAFPTVPPRVDYRLTPLGESLATPLIALIDWVKAARAEIETSRREYDGR